VHTININLAYPIINQKPNYSQKDSTLQEYRDKVWPNWIDLQDICASSTASGVGAVSSKGLGSTSTTKSSQIDLNKDLEVHDDTSQTYL
jgi:hypothetical protein